MGLDPAISRSGFDNAKVVNIVPHGNNNNMRYPETGLGAQWSVVRPATVLLVVAVYQYTGISGAELNIDGERVTLVRDGTVTDMENMSGVNVSTQAFLTPLSTVEKILRSKRTWLRVYTPTGTLEDAIIDGQMDSKAYHALERFMAAVRAP